MGREVLGQIEAQKELSLSAALDQEPGSVGPIFIQTLDQLKGRPDVMIDFSSPAGTGEVAPWCHSNRVPLVTGTTGRSKVQDKRLAMYSRRIPIFSSPNMSLGINGMIGALGAFLESFQQGEVSVVEIHHKYKKDKPSGTAKLLSAELKAGAQRGVIIAEPVSLRGGDVFGVHKVFFFGEGEWVSFEHHATGREVFALGALKAAAWLVGRRSGLYSMQDYFASRRGQ